MMIKKQRTTRVRNLRQRKAQYEQKTYVQTRTVVKSSQSIRISSASSDNVHSVFPQELEP